MENKKIIDNYKRLAEFLHHCFLDNCEIVVHDFTEINNSIVAIFNGEISNRNVGAPVTDFALEILKNRRYEKEDYIATYTTVTKTGKKLRSATYFIKNDEDELIGLLCINIDVSIYERVINIFSCFATGSGTRRVDEPVQEEVIYNLCAEEGVETFSSSVEEMIDEIIFKTTNGLPVERLLSDEKIEVVRRLNEKGVFMLKGGVAIAAKALAISEATVYRYLSKLKNTLD